MSTRNGGSQKKNGVRRNKICLMRRGGFAVRQLFLCPWFPSRFCLSLNSCQLRALRLPPCIIRFSPIDHLPFPSVYFFSPSTNTYPPQSLLSLVSPSAYRHSYSARIRSAPAASYRVFIRHILPIRNWSDLKRFLCANGTNPVTLALGRPFIL